ncbi:hypothetical protein I204_02623 [Kwoniella mangroviensis CBS 8886]|nr:hypothetical protein I204_02623 [Kwoniella mangroviensis CBS 8886]
MPPRKPTTSAPPLPLPIEIFSLVFTYLLDTDGSSLARCCRVSHSFFDVAAPVLYQRVIVSPDPARDSRRDFAPDRITANGKEKTSTRKKKLLKNAQVVTIDFHHATWCGNKSFKYPKLHTLVLNLAKCLDPKKLVLVNACFTNISGDMLGVPFKLLKDAEQLTFIATLTPIHPSMMSGGFPRDQSKLKKVVWIFHAPTPARRWSPGNQDILGERERSRLDGDMDIFVSVIRSFPDIPIYIVNAGYLDHRYAGVKEWREDAVQDKFAETLKQKIIMEGFRRGRHWGADGKIEANEDPEEIRKEKEAEKLSLKKFNTIKLLTMKGYLENHDWTGEFDCKEAKLWLV